MPRVPSHVEGEVLGCWPERTTVTTVIYSGSRRGYLSYFEQRSDSREKEGKDQLGSRVGVEGQKLGIAKAEAEYSASSKMSIQ